MVGEIAEIISSRIFHKEGYQKPHRNSSLDFVGCAGSLHFFTLYTQEFWIQNLEIILCNWTNRLKKVSAIPELIHIAISNLSSFYLKE